jgi:hypothetical protein
VAVASALYNEDSGPAEDSSVTLKSLLGDATPTSTLQDLSDDALLSSYIPAGLQYAVLDDNRLVRKNLERILTKHLKAHEISVYRGATLHEASFFPHEIVQVKVDVAIFDECLDYEDDSAVTLSGTKLADAARTLGFKGCAILHSAHAHLSDGNHEVFDGVIEKTSSKTSLLKGLELAWATYQQRLARSDGNL